MDKQERYRKAILDTEELSSTPAVLSKVYRVVQNPQSDLNDISELIQTDAGLTTDVLRISNSALFGPHAKHTTLQSALLTVGLREVYRLVSVSMARQLFMRDLSCYGIVANDYWSSSLLSALLMDRIAKRLKIDSGEAYLLGILHCTGRILINKILESDGATVIWDGVQPLATWEKSACGLDSGEAGSLLLKHWHFPDTICDAIQNQFSPKLPDGHRSLLGMLQFVRRILPVKRLIATITDPTFDDPFLMATKISMEEIHSIIATSIENLIKLEASLK